MIVYGLSTCDTCKKAIKALTAAGHAPQFRDVRAQPLSEDEIAQIVGQFGAKAVNMQSTTYRGFSDFMKNAEPEAQIAAHPAVMKRPVIHADVIHATGAWYLGWDAKVQADLGL